MSKFQLSCLASLAILVIIVDIPVQGFTISSNSKLSDLSSFTKKKEQEIGWRKSYLQEQSSDAKSEINRRSSLGIISNLFTSIPTIASTTILGTTVVTPLPAFAAKDGSYPQSENDKKKIIQGYKRLDYLLKNWEKETTTCKRNDNPYNGCDRTPEKVMEYLGYKSMEDPLFRADKTMIRLQALVPADNVEGANEFQDAIETWMEKAEEGNGMAFISSWGEANPGGGRDRVELFIERSRKDVEEARASLSTVIRILGLQVD